MDHNIELFLLFDIYYSIFFHLIVMHRPGLIQLFTLLLSKEFMIDMSKLPYDLLELCHRKALLLLIAVERLADQMLNRCVLFDYLLRFNIIETLLQDVQVRLELLLGGELVKVRVLDVELLVVGRELPVDVEDILDEVVDVHVELAEHINNKKDICLGITLH